MKKTLLRNCFSFSGILVVTLFASAFLEAENSNSSLGSIHQSVSAADYCLFLNSVDASDAYFLYHQKMGSDVSSASIIRGDVNGEDQYFVLAGSEMKPIHFVTPFDEACYCHWLEDGQVGDKNQICLNEGAYLFDEVNETIVENRELLFTILNEEGNQETFFEYASLASSNDRMRIALANRTSTLALGSVQETASEKSISTPMEEVMACATCVATVILGKRVREYDDGTDAESSRTLGMRLRSGRMYYPFPVDEVSESSGRKLRSGNIYSVHSSEPEVPVKARWAQNFLGQAALRIFIVHERNDAIVGKTQERNTLMKKIRSALVDQWNLCLESSDAREVGSVVRKELPYRLAAIEAVEKNILQVNQLAQKIERTREQITIYSNNTTQAAALGNANRAGAFRAAKECAIEVIAQLEDAQVKRWEAAIEENALEKKRLFQQAKACEVVASYLTEAAHVLCNHNLGGFRSLMMNARDAGLREERYRYFIQSNEPINLPLAPGFHVHVGL